MIQTKTSLYEHQQAAVNKLSPLLAGALFMEMGTGKTRTAIELAKRWNVSNVVWFTPVSLKETVRQELVKHVKWSRPYVFDYRTRMRGLSRHFWTIIGIESMSSSTRQILSARSLVNESTLVIVDESSFIKGHKSWRTLRITDIGKLVRNEFKEKNLQAFGVPNVEMTNVEYKIVQDFFLTPAIVEKVLAQMTLEQPWSSRRIPEFLSRVWHDFATKELWDILKKHKNPTIDFKRLNRYVIAQVKAFKPELF